MVKIDKKCDRESVHIWTDTQTDAQMQTGFVIYPMLYAVAVVQIKTSIELI